MFTQTMKQNPGAIKVGWYWFSMILACRIGEVRKLENET